MNKDEFIQEQFKAKLSHRGEQANLPIEEKVKILIKLQWIAYIIGKQQGRNPSKPWHSEGLL